MEYSSPAQAKPDELSYLLLDYLADLPSSVEFMDRPNADEIFNLPHHGLSYKDLAARLRDLYHCGFIAFRLDDKALAPCESAWPESIRPWVAMLTADGGKAWEERFQPDWERFVGYEAEYEDRGKASIEILEYAALRQETILRIRDRLSRFPLSRIAMAEVRPWVATYWKHFPLGYRLRLEIQAGTLPPDADLIFRDPGWRHPSPRFEKPPR